MMEYVTLGRTGVRVSQICIGTAFRGQWDDDMCAKTIERALEYGVNFIDTSNVYGEGRIGQAEHVLGEVLQGKRDQVILATKIFNPVGDGPNDQGLSRVHLMREIDRSLSRLKTDYVDILFLHEPDIDTALDESLRAADAIVKQGKARYIGLSRFPAWQVAKAMWIADRHNYEPVSVVQYRYNLIYREAELEMLPFLRDSGLGLMVYSPLAIGLLSGQFRRSEAPPSDTPWGQGYTGFDQLMTSQTEQVVEELRIIADNHGKTQAQVAIAWLLSHPEVTAVNIGPDIPEQVDENVGAVGWQLTEDERLRLDELSAPPWASRP
jgi:aryl-alcohol dehydrogenase-like predicted oxidoreductase